MAHNYSALEFGSDPVYIRRSLTVDAGFPRDIVEIRTFWGGGIQVIMRDSDALIQGEDLFALREFLAEIPEESFVRPADPVKMQWIAGDIVATDDAADREAYTYVRGSHGKWAGFGPRANGFLVGDDSDIEELIYGDRSVRTYRIIRRNGQFV